MYIWRIKPLREQLADEGLSTKEAFQYYFATILLGAVLFESVSLRPSSGEFQPIELLDTILYFICVTGGLIWCYRQNGGAEGADFLPRLVPISWVMFWRLVSVVIPFFALLGLFNYFQTGEFGRPGADSPVLTIVMNVLYGGMWWRKGVHMKWVAEQASR